METFGCSFFVHSGWVSGSNSDGVGVVWTDFCVRTAGRRRRRCRKRPAIDEGVDSCEDAVMVMTSPLTAKVGLWDTAGRERGDDDFSTSMQHLFLFFNIWLQRKRALSLSVSESLQNHFFPQTFKFLRASGSESGMEEKRANEKVMQRYKILVKGHKRGMKAGMLGN